MTGLLSTLLSSLLKIGAVAMLLNEVRGLILAAPVMYAMYEAGGSLMAIWLGVSSLAGIALSVVVPMFALKKVQAKLDRGQTSANAAVTA
ncbi:hypothetical protein [Tsuneonella mangrovi]|uniref:hypothetical protein n=1 Tax=Tsuneonella mangrovi TaxID=1982042 RepID=UPI000BA25092|nr:hypothetical protein [Tsuneonella mangrovi]